MPAFCSPRSVNALTNAIPCSPAGTKMKTASGFASFARCTNGAKSGFRSGTRTDPTTWPPCAENDLRKAFSASMPGA